MITAIIKELVCQLVQGKFDTIFSNDWAKKITEAELRAAVSSYGGAITMPPENAFENLEIYDISPFEKCVDIDLWFDNERSDLTLSCSCYLISEKWVYAIDNIHVL